MKRLLVPAVAMLVAVATASEAAERKLGTIGPPPRQSPQRQTSAESLPPLPLPATPLRRSEPKAEPSPPLFVARLKYGEYQDYMPNPGDLDNLLRHVREQLDVWYGHQMVSADEIATVHEKGGAYAMPVLYVTGYHPFELTDRQRGALRQYVLDGGMLIGDATLGSGAFADSFRREAAQMFPKRRMAVLAPDHPIYRSYYTAPTAQYFSVARGTASIVKGPPVLEGVNIAARTAIVLSPYDMTCGWDGFYAPPADARVPEAPRTKAVLPGDAVRLGINLIAYAAAERRFAKAQASTREIMGQQPQRRAAVTIGVLRHHGDWNADPNSLYQLVRLAARQTSMPVSYALRPVDAKVEQLIETPFVVMTGMDEPGLTETEIDALKRHVQAGGFLFINNTSGFARFDAGARQLIAAIMPDQKLQVVPADHELMNGLYHVREMRDAATGNPRPAGLEAVFVGGRAAVVYAPTDTLAMLKGIHDPFANAYDTESARKLALNITSYAMRH